MHVISHVSIFSACVLSTVPAINAALLETREISFLGKIEIVENATFFHEFILENEISASFQSEKS